MESLNADLSRVGRVFKPVSEKAFPWNGEYIQRNQNGRAGDARWLLVHEEVVANAELGQVPRELHCITRERMIFL